MKSSRKSTTFLPIPDIKYSMQWNAQTGIERSLDFSLGVGAGVAIVDAVRAQRRRAETNIMRLKSRQ